jgi:nucleoid DNA-binding protein
MSTIQKAAKEAGVDQVICPHCGAKFSTAETIKRFFKGVLELIRRGERVTIPDFGNFKAIIWKGRSHSTPIIPGGKLSFKDTWILKFKQGKNAREFLNAPVNKEAS